VFDSCANGQQLECLTVIDEFAREYFAIDVAGGIRSPRCGFHAMVNKVSTGS
jgi:putative transposase